MLISSYGFGFTGCKLVASWLQVSSLNDSLVTLDTVVNGTSGIVFASTGIPSDQRSRIAIYKYGKVATLRIGTVQNQASAWTTAFTLPVGYRPMESVMVPALGDNGTICGIYIGTNGGVSYFLHNTSQTYNAQIAFIVSGN